jgi:hypothetical protein
MTLPAISDTVQYFPDNDGDPVAAIVIGRGYLGTVNLALFPDKHHPIEKWFQNHRYDVLYVPQGTEPPAREEYCSFPRVESPTPSNLSIVVT